jgi:formylglycine-generating enzyme required for sulfatase activity
LAVRLAGYSEFTGSIEGKAGETRSVEARLLPLMILYGGSEMVLVDGGKFQMGDETHGPDERPLHWVELPAFYIDKYETTNQQYKEFCVAEHKEPPANPEWDTTYFTARPEFPVLQVDYEGAVAFAAAVGKRLPTEQEWEKAAGWDPARERKLVYPWGDQFSPTQTNISGRPSQIGAYPGDKSPYGAFDMAGNAAEWVDGLYAPYPGNDSFKQRADTVGEGSLRGFISIVQRTADFKAADWARVAQRGHAPRKFPAGMGLPIGLRCAISADDPRMRDTINARTREGAGGSR